VHVSPGATGFSHAQLQGAGSACGAGRRACGRARLAGRRRGVCADCRQLRIGALGAVDDCRCVCARASQLAGEPPGLAGRRRGLPARGAQLTGEPLGLAARRSSV